MEGWGEGFILPFGPKTSGSKEDSVSKEKGFILKGILDQLVKKE